MRPYQNVAEYVRGLKAAIRTHQRLNDTDKLQVVIEPEGELPLVQRILLR